MIHVTEPPLKNNGPSLQPAGQTQMFPACSFILVQRGRPTMAKVIEDAVQKSAREKMLFMSRFWESSHGPALTVWYAAKIRDMSENHPCQEKLIKLRLAVRSP